eukprot:GHVN01084674.1.p1 GENE.GHVN01084674.1~~GHVN01084674.1.p1  ORF type:complete len:280 (+),score=44.99 GHVN01084674.1:116-955(+)
MGCIVCVPEDKLYVIEKCGEFQKIARPGCTVVGIPYICTVRGEVSRRVHQALTVAETKTKDNVFVTIRAATQYKVIEDKAVESFYTLDNALAQLQSYVFDVIRSHVPQMTLDLVFESKDSIATAVLSHLQEEMEAYGYAILHTLIIDIIPAEHVKRSMNSINAEKRLRKAAEEKAEAQKLTVVKAAEAESEYQYLQGLGIARQRHVIIKGMGDSVANFSDGTHISPKTVTDLVVVNQYFDTIKELCTKHGSQVVFVSEDPNNPESLKDAMMQVRVMKDD